MLSGHRRPFAKINDDDIILHDKEAAKTIIAVNPDLDRAMRLLDKLADQVEALLPPGQQAFGPSVLVAARVRGNHPQAREGALGQNCCRLPSLADIV